VPGGAEMLIGAPADDPPPELSDALRELATNHPQVRALYVFQLMILEEGEEPHLTLGLDLDDGADVVAISNDLGGRAVDVLPEGSSLDVYPLPEDMLAAVTESVEPIYARTG
jgi:type III secretion system (T3SS) SseB-like protein